MYSILHTSEMVKNLQLTKIQNSLISAQNLWNQYTNQTGFILIFDSCVLNYYTKIILKAS